MARQRSSLPFFLTVIAASLCVLAITYLPTLQTIPNGSEHYYMIDAGETQIVLNVWGTLHATGYPLYVVTGSAAVVLLRAFGISPAAAPAVVSLIWGLAALAGMAVLAAQTGLGRRTWLIAALVVVYGLTRTVWIHQVVAEIYSFTLLLLVALLVLALWRGRIPGRVYWLAVLGGVAVAHHRALIVVAPALLFAVWVELAPLLRRRPAHLLILLALGLIGLLPYLYLVLRAQAGAPWVYGEPGTLAGLWDQFIGTEASRFIGAPGTVAGLLDNVRLVTEVIVTDLSVLGAALGIVGLAVGIARPHTRRAAVTLALAALGAYAFHCILYTDILSALILIITFSLAFGWYFLAGTLLPLAAMQIVLPPQRAMGALARSAAAAGAVALAASALISANHGFIISLTTDRTGLETIALAQHSPPGSTLMLAWGARHFAVGFARSVLGILPGVDLVDHKADMRAAAEAGTLVTPAYTFYRQPISWWEERLGSRVYPVAVAPGLVAVPVRPARSASTGSPNTSDDRVTVRSHRLFCTEKSLVLDVTWQASATPTHDQSVFVHLLSADERVLAQDDRNAPVYGLRPLTTWLSGEIVHDMYVLPRSEGAAQVRYGLYTQQADGVFVNSLEVVMPVDCPQ